MVSHYIVLPQVQGLLSAICLRECAAVLQESWATIAADAKTSSTGFQLKDACKESDTICLRVLLFWFSPFRLVALDAFP